jgi:hypothetical protein
MLGVQVPPGLPVFPLLLKVLKNGKNQICDAEGKAISE